MKAIFLLFAFNFLLSCNLSKNKTPDAAPPTFNEVVEKEIIFKTIDNETSSFYKRDYVSWKKYFIQKDYAFQAWNNSDGSFDASIGWANVDGRIGKYIKDNPVSPGKSMHSKVEKRNLVVHFFSENLAYLSWDQYNSDQNMEIFTPSKEQRIMEKESGEWKIVNVSAYWDYKTRIPADSLR